MGFVSEIGIQGLNMLGNAINSQIQYGQTKKLMNIQQQNQMALNEQGQQLQMETWRQTNFPAQMEMLKQAGLNPGLMYAKGGAGGTTGSQGGGSASMGSAPNRVPMDMQNILAMRQMQTSTELIEAQKGKTLAEQKEIEARTPTYETSIGKMIAETANERLKGELIKVQTAMETIKTAQENSVIKQNLELLGAQASKLRTENALTNAQFDSLVKEASAKAVGASIENELTRAKVNLTNTEKQAVITGIVQKWTELQMRETSLSQEQERIEIQKFTAEMANKYPNVTNVAGGLIQGALNQLEAIGRYYNPKVFDYAVKKPQ